MVSFELTSLEEIPLRNDEICDGCCVLFGCVFCSKVNVVALMCHINRLEDLITNLTMGTVSRYAKSFRILLHMCVDKGYSLKRIECMNSVKEICKVNRPHMAVSANAMRHIS